MWCILQGNVILNRKWHLPRARWEVTGSWTGITVGECLCITSVQAFSIQPGSQRWHKKLVTCTSERMKSLPWSAEGSWPAPVHLGKPQPSLLLFLVSGCHASSQQPIVPILRLPGSKNTPSALPQAWRLREHISRWDSHSWVCDGDVYTSCHSKSRILHFCLWIPPLLLSDDWIEDRPPFVMIASLWLSLNFSRGFPPFFFSLSICILHVHGWDTLPSFHLSSQWSLTLLPQLAQNCMKHRMERMTGEDKELSKIVFKTSWCSIK